VACALLGLGADSLHRDRITMGRFRAAVVLYDGEASLSVGGFLRDRDGVDLRA
jgi:hypothetical protein